MHQVLTLDHTGQPRHWISCEDAVTYVAKNLVVWSLGKSIATFHGGFQKDGHRSIIETPPIIAIRGKPFNYEKSGKVLLTNKTLFARDRHTCAFCGNHFFEKNLSRDHIHPVSRGGRDVWTNVVTACIPCNLRKGDKYLSQAGMELLYVPYEPNHYENLILLNRNILQDQMDYLLNGVPKHSRVWQ